MEYYYMEDKMINMESVQEYIQNHIIEKAKSLLSDKQMTVSQAAYALGYKYPNHLSRMFKRATGI